MKIQSIHARQIIDSRGNPTVEADVMLEGGYIGRASVPSGASTGTHEALELRDADTKVFGGKGVRKAVNNVNTEIAKALVGIDAGDQRKIDEALMSLDGTPNKSRLGANAILAVSLAVAKAAALSENIPLYVHIKNISGNKKDYLLPVPMVNIVNGGAHTNWQTTKIQEFMIVPTGAKTFPQGLQMCAEVFHKLGKILLEAGLTTAVGDEGGYAPKVEGEEQVFELIIKAIEQSGYSLGTDISLALDVAATEIYKGTKVDTGTVVAQYKEYIEKYKVISIEDGLPEDDWQGWQKLTSALGDEVQLVGDDLFVTNTKFLERGINEKAGNAILIKLNQIGTLSETIDAVKMAEEAGFAAIISHRSGETEDTTIAHLSVGLSTGQIKCGSMSRTDRIAKYNELLRIEESLGENAKYGKPN